ncbi:MAG: AMP-binding protein [Deltaproteobacteria bacterium]|nr:AMP-binding protein [Deltaproteobacteria bacterium]
MEERALGNGFFDRARETMDWEIRRKRLSRQFVDTFRHAYEHTDAYKEHFGSAGIHVSDIKDINDMEKLPILRMETIVERQKKDPPFGGFETGNPADMRRIYVNPGLIYQPGEQHYLDTSWAEALCAAGFEPEDRILNTFNYHLWPFAFMLDESVRMIGGTVIPSGIGNTLMQIRIMQGLKINGFMGTPSFLMTMIQRAEGMKLDLKHDIHLKKALVAAEMLPESLRSRLQDKLGMSIRQGYGTVFLGCIGYECAYMTGLHVPDSIYVEVVDPHTGKATQPGAAGEIVATSFNKYYPMIRVATGDISILTHQSCSCGRNGLMLKKILGRTDQATKVRGTFVHTWQTDEVISRHPEVFKYQVVITRENHNDIMTFVVELKEEQREFGMIRARIERDIKDILTIRGVVQVVPKGTIPDFHKKIEDQRTWE